MDLSTLSDSELKIEMENAYRCYMYEEAAERNYNAEASRAEFSRYSAAAAEIKRRSNTQE